MHSVVLAAALIAALACITMPSLATILPNGTIPLPAIRLMGDPQLLRPAQAVKKATVLSEAFQRNLTILTRKLNDEMGVGIAGPQIGEPSPPRTVNESIRMTGLTRR